MSRVFASLIGACVVLIAWLYLFGCGGQVEEIGYGAHCWLDDGGSPRSGPGFYDGRVYPVDRVEPASLTVGGGTCSP